MSGPEDTTESKDPEEKPAPVPLLTLRDGLPGVIERTPDLEAVAEQFAAGSGPVAIDAERASGYRYSSRAYLIQLRREGAGTALVDPTAFDDLAPLAEALDGVEWILHAATQDLACLAEVGLRPSSLFDTELAGRLLGYPRVGLATLVETALGHHLRKEHSAADWSKRPLPESWLEYAALDVEPLGELREAMATELVESGKDEWARQEFEHLLDFTPTQRAEPWRRTSQVHKIRNRRALAAVRALWGARDRIAAERDITPGRILPDSAIIAAATAMPSSRRALLGLKDFNGRGASRHATAWLEAIQEARDLDEADLPRRAARHDGPPPPRAWADKDPRAGRRLAHSKQAMADLSEALHVPVENLVTPDSLRRVLWTPPATRDPEPLLSDAAGMLSDLGARPWQVELVAPVVRDATLAGDQEPDVPEAD
ncbi:ribonuclease D [Nocardioides sp. AE5]|uniref:ribonuclease D n=1 Tax=Nocardioides sp. AE5 TaxID=2962573 RepID=UPI0028819431|nr:ribonuclease D [Nocardioides sp. AE5]MDT0203781.1 ribonuclease D [Nocardioides sp. AE5]